ncbi:jg20832 [Pararge aegeria aegeria]|uniref:Jg20832 protein n=1 Tax=Pararge aegeria aegeria TaxID=348720 RepID=A0A8S4R6D6_9NEOP|nr:jg20832 [Pararge aegeria aegeria]
MIPVRRSLAARAGAGGCARAGARQCPGPAAHSARGRSSESRRVPQRVLHDGEKRASRRAAVRVPRVRN